MFNTIIRTVNSDLNLFRMVSDLRNSPEESLAIQDVLTMEKNKIRKDRVANFSYLER